VNAPAKVKTANVHSKLMRARAKFHGLELKKTGKNSFAGYSYFELGDFLVPALKVFDEIGLGATISFTQDLASMTIVDLDNPEDRIVLTSPMGSAALKGCHEVQNIGAVETYQRRYLWVAALEIVEHDALDASTGRETPKAANNGNDDPFPQGPAKNKTQLKEMGRAFWRDVEACGDSDELEILLADKTNQKLVGQLMIALPQWWDGGERNGESFEGLEAVIARKRRDFEMIDDAHRRNPILAG